MPEVPDEAWCDIAPDWVCEVVSPSTGRLDRVRKMPKYALGTSRCVTEASNSSQTTLEGTLPFAYGRNDNGKPAVWLHDDLVALYPALIGRKSHLSLNEIVEPATRRLRTTDGTQAHRPRAIMVTHLRCNNALRQVRC